MTVTRRELFRAAGLGAGALMLGSTSLTAQAAAVVKPPFAAPTAARPMRLCFNENALGMSPAAQVAATDAVLHQASLYPFVRCGALAKACADFMGGKPENIMLTHGSAESIRAAIEAYITPDAQLVIPELTYGDGEDTAVKNGLKVVKVKMGAQWSIDIEGMKKAVAAHKGRSIVYFVNPNNPTSTVVDSKVLNKWIASRPANTFFVIDEAYAEYVQSKKFVSCKTLVDQGFDNVCVLKTFSKIFAMAGMRVGFTYAAPSVIKNVRRKVAYDVMIGIPAVEAALAEVTDRAFIAQSRQENARARAILNKALDELGIERLESQTNFVFMNLKAPLKPFAERMRAEHIWVGRPFPPAVQWCRISLGTVEDMTYFVEKLKEFRAKGWV